MKSLALFHSGAPVLRRASQPADLDTGYHLPIRLDDPGRGNGRARAAFSVGLLFALLVVLASMLAR